MVTEDTAVLTQNMADLRAVVVQQPPTIFVNGKPPASFGVRQLVDLLSTEVEVVGKK